jgi:hypothetical protein
MRIKYVTFHNLSYRIMIAVIGNVCLYQISNTCKKHPLYPVKTIDPVKTKLSNPMKRPVASIS